MLKATIALSALLIVGATATAFGYEDPENQIADRYPFLEQSYNPAAARSVSPRHMTNSQAARLNQDVEDPENQIADRYPFLAQNFNPAVTHSVGPRRVAGSQTAKLSTETEDPENKIGDRYPFLEQTVKLATVKQQAMTRTVRSMKPITVSQKALLNRETSRVAY